MRIAMIGLRGVPASYSGIETAVEEIGSRLAAQGNEVTVYCMAGRYTEKRTEYRGMRLVYVPTIRSKNAEMIVYSVLSTARAILSRHDVIHFHALGPSTMAMLTWLTRRPSVATCHGLDYNREKWGRLARTYLKLGEFASARFAREVIVVSETLAAYFAATYGRATRFIPNGAAPVHPAPLGEKERALGLEAGRYVLFVGRLVECKRVKHLIDAFKATDTPMKLVVVGTGPEDILADLRQRAEGDDRIVLTGALHGDDLRRVFSNAGLFVLPSVLEGLPVALIEALSYNLPVIVSDIPENLEVVRDGTDYRAAVVKADDLASLREGLTASLSDLDALREKARGNSRFVGDKYDWDRITQQTLECYRAAARAGEGTDDRHPSAREAV
jgi:glycosyltransferase involved in cell wall biosynthesis